MASGEAAAAEYRRHLRCYLAWVDRQIEVAIAQREDPIRHRRIVAPDVLPPGLARMREPPVEFDGGLVSFIEHVAVLVVAASAISALALAGRQSMRSFDASVIAALQDRVQASGVE